MPIERTMTDSEFRRLVALSILEQSLRAADRTLSQSVQKLTELAEHAIQGWPHEYLDDAVIKTDRARVERELGCAHFAHTLSGTEMEQTGSEGIENG